MRWQLSFVDPDRPKGEKCIGGCIVEALNIVEAVQAAHAQGINPGGEVALLELDEDLVKNLSFDLQPYMWRLLSVDEMRALDERVRAETDS